MSEILKTVAVLVANPALSSILSTTLAGVRALRVRPFETALALTTYLRLVPADLVVIDFDNTSTRAVDLAATLRDDPRLAARHLQVVALASTLPPETRQAAIDAGIDEIILKPMSPRYLVERIMARLAATSAVTEASLEPAPAIVPVRPRPLATQDWASFGANVIPLFGSATEHGTVIH